MVMEKIIFDTDPGIDDGMALLLIHSLEALDVVGITTVFGNASIDTCTRNALYMCERFSLPYPVYRGAGVTIEGEDEIDFPETFFCFIETNGRISYIIDRVLLICNIPNMNSIKGKLHQ